MLILTYARIEFDQWILGRAELSFRVRGSELWRSLPGAIQRKMVILV